MEIIIILILLIAVITLSICLLKLKQGTSKPNNQQTQKEPTQNKKMNLIVLILTTPICLIKKLTY